MTFEVVVSMLQCFRSDLEIHRKRAWVSLLLQLILPTTFNLLSTQPVGNDLYKKCIQRCIQLILENYETDLVYNSLDRDCFIQSIVYKPFP